MKKVVPNRIMRTTDGKEYDAPDAPIAYSCERNPDGTWTIEDGDPE